MSGAYVGCVPFFSSVSSVFVSLRQTSSARVSAPVWLLVMLQALVWSLVMLQALAGLWLELL